MRRKRARAAGPLSERRRFLFDGHAARQPAAGRQRYDLAAIPTGLDKPYRRRRPAAESVFDAVAPCPPWGVDVSSGIESGTGIRDGEKMRRFVEEVRRADCHLDDDDSGTSAPPAGAERIPRGCGRLAPTRNTRRHQHSGRSLRAGASSRDHQSGNIAAAFDGRLPAFHPLPLWGRLGRECRAQCPTTSQSAGQGRSRETAPAAFLIPVLGSP